jgi:hypothetical protein
MNPVNNAEKVNDPVGSDLIRVNGGSLIDTKWILSWLTQSLAVGINYVVSPTHQDAREYHRFSGPVMSNIVILQL